MDVVRALDKFTEEKYVTNDQLTGYTVTSSGTVQVLTSITQGAKRTERIGDKVLLRRLAIRGLIYPNAMTSWGCIRLVLVKWFGDSVPNASDIIEGISGTGLSIFYPVGTRVEAGFEVLWDKTFKYVKYDKTEQYFGDYAVVPFEYFYDFMDETLRMRRINFVGGSPSSGDGHLYLLAVGTDPGLPINVAPYLTWVSTVYYSDC
jgi:hypothetical protein